MVVVFENVSNMCDRNGNAWFGGPRSSSNFLSQRKITYVDNPFDEQASMGMLNYDLTYLNRPAKKHEMAKKESSPCQSSRSGELFDEDDRDSTEKGEIWNFASQRESCEMSDWSSLFSPVQVNVWGFFKYYSVKIRSMHVYSCADLIWRYAFCAIAGLRRIL